MNDETNAERPKPEHLEREHLEREHLEREHLEREHWQPESSAHRLVLIALSAALATFAIATFYPSGRPVDETMELSFGASHAWVGSQSFLLTMPGLMVGLMIARMLPRLGSLIGAGIMFAVPVIVFCDVITFAWIGERFLSGTMKRISTTLLPAMMYHITRSSVIDAVIALCLCATMVSITWWLAGMIGRKWVRSRDPVRPLTATSVLAVLCFLVSLPAIWDHGNTRRSMRYHSLRHPFCAFHLVGYRGVGIAVPVGEKAILARLRGLQSAPSVQKMDERLLSVKLDRDQFRENAHLHNLQDVIVVIVESLRPEILDPEVMPNLYEFSQKSIYCKQHFSNGNSTIYGVFGLMSGVESIWYDRPVGFRPIMNRVLYQAEYQLAFYGGAADWEAFDVDGYIRGSHFDYFEIEDAKPPETDYRTVQRTLDFIMEGKRLAKEQSKFAVPRLAIAYMLSTHCRYTSEEQDQIFQPAAPENFLLPYSEAAVPQIYNRYKNSARMMDRMIKPLLRDDCIVIVIGDHGESFLEDGSAIHGLRLSKVQNMTPMVMYYPGVEPRVIEQRTIHADILPTLLSILGIPVTDPDVFDGADLTTLDAETLENRVFITSNFMDRTTALIGPWTFDPNRPFAYRFLCNIKDWQVDYLNPIDEQGYETPDAHPPGTPDGRQLVRDWLIKKIGPEIVREDKSEAELFTEFFRSADRETRLSALKIANDIGEPEPYLHDLIVEAASDTDPEIRELAKMIVIRTARYAGRN